MLKYAREHGIVLATSHIYMNNATLLHARRDSKIIDMVDVPVERIKMFPSERRSLDLYYDKQKRTFLYTDGTAKYIINPHGRIRLKDGRSHAAMFITAEKLNTRETFKGSQYDKIE